MIKDEKPKSRIKFTRTSRAIKKIKDSSIRDDFAEMLYGLEFSYANRQRRLAAKCAGCLVGMAVGLNRTISPALATEILHGMIQDGKQDPIISNLIDEHKDQKCVRGECSESKNATCITIKDATGGCGNKFQFQFPWRMLSA